MESKTYERLYEHIAGILRKIEGAIPSNKITDEIKNATETIKLIGAEMYGKVIGIDSFIEPIDVDWQKLARELEEHFDVKMAGGILIQGEEHVRNTKWWTSEKKQESDKYYWNRLKNHLQETLPPEVIKTLDADTDIIMDNIENPSLNESFSRYGMVVGHVQSGKTGNFSALVCKAADSGYKFIVVISGDKNNLRNQTQERLNETFIGQSNGNATGAGKGNSNKGKLPISLTTDSSDFNVNDATRASQGLNFDNVRVPILLVIKKNTKTLDNVIKWLENQYSKRKIDHAMLVVDDESDYASINTRNEDDPTAINRKMRTLITLFLKSAYVAYTATPYANIFISHQIETDDYGKDLFPKDFIYALEAPTNYFGARKVFLDSKKKFLVPIEDWKEILPYKHKSDFQVSELPLSLMDAIRTFTLVYAIRSLRGQNAKHNSMLIHVSRFTNLHKTISFLTEKYLDEIKEAVVSYGKLKDAKLQSKILNELEQSFNFYYNHIEFNWKQVIEKLSDIIQNVVMREVHQSTSVTLEYLKDFPTCAIVVGGTSLARGYTLEGLSISYFIRSTIFFDTLMQMGRWFGYRSGYEDLCRIYMPSDRITDFAEIIGSTEELFDDFKLMAEKKMTPNDFGLAVKENPDSLLQITARNKLKDAIDFNHSMRLDGRLKETSYLPNGSNDIEYNLDKISQFTKILNNISKPISIKPSRIDSSESYLWRSVDRELIRKFLGSFRFYGNDTLGLTTRMPVDFIKKFSEEKLIDWDVSLHGGSGDVYTVNGLTIKKQLRQLKRKQDHLEVLNRQVSSGSSEAISIENDLIRKEIGDDRRKARENSPRPLLMLHILQERQPNETNQNIELISEIAAIGVSFPGNAASKSETITLKINTVMYQNLLKKLKESEEYETLLNLDEEIENSDD